MVSDTSEPICPACGLSRGQEKQFSSFAFKGCDNEHLMDPKEREMVMANRKMHERMILTGARDTGEMTVKESGPAWSRPFGNSDFARKQAIENTRLVSNEDES